MREVAANSTLPKPERLRCHSSNDGHTLIIPTAFRRSGAHRRAIDTSSRFAGTLLSTKPPLKLFLLQKFRTTRTVPIRPARHPGRLSNWLQVADQGVLPAARVIELFAGSPLTTSNIQKDSLILAVNGQYLQSAQDLINRLNQEFEYGESVNFTLLQNGEVRNESVNLWDPEGVSAKCRSAR